MKSAVILLFLALNTAARGGDARGCGRTGALRCDADGRHQSVCTSGGAWVRMRDCAASNAACLEGRCVPQLSSNVTRAGQCTPGTWGCADCERRQFCSASGNWVDFGKCGDDSVCICGECKPSKDNFCSGPVICSASSVGHRFPNLAYCNQYYFCEEASKEPESVSCDTGKIYDPCLEDCIVGGNLPCLQQAQCDSSNNGKYEAVLGNPSQYYLCGDGAALLQRCDGIFLPSIEFCWPSTSICSNNYHLNRSPRNVNKHIKKRHVSYDDCSNIGGDGGNGGSGTIPSQCTVGEKWPVPNNECQYYSCINSTTSKVEKCPPNTKFNATTKTCVLSQGSCI